MHVLLVHQFFATPASNGGTRHYEFFMRLKDNGFNFTVIASSEQLKNVADEKTDSTNLCDIISISSLPLGNKGYIWRVFGFLSFMVLAVLKGLSVRKVNVVIGTSPSLFQALSAFIIASIRRKPFLLEVRDLWPAFAVDIGLLKSPVLIRMAEWLELFLYRKADHIVVNSPAYISYLINKNVQESKITLIPNGVDVDAFSSATEQVMVNYREAWGIPDNRYLIVYAGAIRMANCLEMLVETAVILEKKKSPVFLVVIGDGRDRRRLEGKVIDFGLENIKFCGSLPKSAIPGAIATADACFAGLKDIPMFTMTYPNKVFDYMAAARPTILAIDGVIRKVVEAAEGGIFVPPSDSAAIADAMHKLSNNPDQSKEMGACAFRYVKEKFNRDDHAVAFAQVLDNLVSKSRPVKSLNRKCSKSRTSYKAA
jgi:glycosyltransferase involved in cell wall biosynthesis